MLPSCTAVSFYLSIGFVVLIAFIPSATCASRAASSASPEKIRADFLKSVASTKEFGWIKKAAEKKKLTQRKKNQGPKTPANLLEKVKALEESASKNTENTTKPTIEGVNKPIADLMLEGDILLTEEQAKQYGMVGDGRQRRSIIEREDAKWPVNEPIAYYFDSSLDEDARNLVRQALNWWTEHTCLQWKEDATPKKKVKIFKGAGCFSQLGRLDFRDEQMLSLGEGCLSFATITHEAAHTMGVHHEMNRPDRDNYIQLIWEQIDESWKRQYRLESKALVYDTVYDYGSNMHYGGYTGNDKIQVFAKEKGFQHTMGNEYGPNVQDIKLINEHYKCFEHCKNTKCQNDGFPHPRDCSKCICPQGFGGADCSQLAAPENGAPASCGQTVQASSQWQPLTGSLDVGEAKYHGGYGQFRHSCCYYHIKAPAGMQVAVKVERLGGQCSNTCVFGSAEVKFGDMYRGGARLCCPEHAEELGMVISKKDLVVISLCWQYKEQAFTLQYRIYEPSMPAPVPLPALPECPAFGTYITVERCQCGKETCKQGKSCFYTPEYPHKFCTDLDPAIYGPPPTGPAPPPSVPAPPPPPTPPAMCPTFGRAQGPCVCGYGATHPTCYASMVCNWSTLRCLSDRASNCVTNAGLCHNQV
ncbi:Protein NAS-28 [Aphelenchoides avenae]|nr:Protein NAS-28 [Aphelenchus avenae]